MDVLDAAGIALAALGPLLVLQGLAMDAPDADLPGNRRDLVAAGAELGGNLLRGGREHLELRAEEAQVGREPGGILGLRHEELRPDGIGLVGGG